MKFNKEKAFLFLRKELTDESIVKAFVFGSFVTEKIIPNDCDIFIVTNQTPMKPKWAEFLNLITATKINFFDTFGLPLNTSINTEKEFTEESAFRTRILAKKFIEII